MAHITGIRFYLKYFFAIFVCEIMNIQNPCEKLLGGERDFRILISQRVLVGSLFVCGKTQKPRVEGEDKFRAEDFSKYPGVQGREHFKGNGLCLRMV